MSFINDYRRMEEILMRRKLLLSGKLISNTIWYTVHNIKTGMAWTSCNSWESADRAEEYYRGNENG